jgi:SpoVK/Ycf46/Vps4 family AAA+-type ATPase
MAVERIRTAFEKTGPYRFTILFGQGIDDAFISHNRKELNIESALMRYLRHQGFQRVLFFSPHQAIYQIDSNSLQAIPITNQQALAENQPGEAQMMYIADGPLGDRMVYRQSPNARSLRERGMGDMHAIRILDSMMKDDSQPPTAIIWSQAESAITFFDDPRLLAGIFADWLHLPASNPHACLLVFAADSRANLQQVAERLPIPEIRSHILRTEPGSQRGIHTVEIGTPDLSEITALVSYAQSLYGFSIHNQDVRRLTRWMADENVRARDWLVKLAEINRFDMETARKNGWFAAHRSDPRSIEDRLNALIGLDSVKDRLFEMAAWLMVNRKKLPAEGGMADPPLLHLVFTGNPGTGKTTVARLIGEIYHEIGILRRGHLVEARVSDLVAEHVGGTAVKTNRVVDEALDGVLFIDEAYRLTEPERGGFGQEALDTLLTRMEDDRQRLVVIVAGYPDRIERFLSSNPGLPRRFPTENRFHFEDYSTGELWQILAMMLQKRGLAYADDLQDDLRDVIVGLYAARDASFGNAGEMRNLVDAIERRRAARIVRQNLGVLEPLSREDIPEKYQEFILPRQPAVNAIRQSLAKLVGWAPFKAYLEQLLNQEPTHTPHITAGSGIQPVGYSHHLVFTGQNGTGKSYGAEILGRCLHQAGLLRKGHVIEVTPEDLLRGGVGQSAHRTRETVRQALDGVLLINKAGALFGGQSFSYTVQEILDGINQAIQDYPQRLVVVISDRRSALEPFLQSQNRLLGRFGAVIEFPDFNPAELSTILAAQVEQAGFRINSHAIEKAECYLSVESVAEGDRFEQVRNVIRLAERLLQAAKDSGAQVIEAKDIPDVSFSVVVATSADAQVSALKKNPDRIIQQEWVLPALDTPMAKDAPQAADETPEPKKTIRHPHRRRR